MSKYLIAYDICDPKRLRRVARFLEKHAIRCQKSVFVFRGTHDRLKWIMEKVGPLIEQREDLVQAWRLASKQPEDGQHCHGEAAKIAPAGVVLQQGLIRFIEEDGN